MDANVRAMKTAAELGLAEAFSQAKGALPGSGDVASRREAAFERFAKTGLPHRRVEAWRYTDLRALLREAKPLAAPPAPEAKAAAEDAGAMFAGLGCRRLLFVDGAFVPELSDLEGLETDLTVKPMAEALADGDELVARHLGQVVPVNDAAVELNTAFMGDGIVLRIAAGATLLRPLHLVFFNTGEAPAAMFVRSLAVIETGASVTLIESHEGAGPAEYQTNIGLDLVIGDEARIDHVKVTREGPNALHIASLMAALGEGSMFNHFAFNTGGWVIRNQLFLQMNGEGAAVDIRGANLLKGRQHADTTLVADHIAGGCQSREVFKSVLSGESRGVFQGKITVRPDAQKTDAKMMAQALLLSETAEFDSKPELEIFADDVQCGHGATAGALDEDLRFYLMARGIPAKEAESLLIQAFVGDAVEGVEHEGLKAALMDATAAWLASGD